MRLLAFAAFRPTSRSTLVVQAWRKHSVIAASPLSATNACGLCCKASLSHSGPTSVRVWAFRAVLQHLTGLGIDTDFVGHATILDIEGIA